MTTDQSSTDAPAAPAAPAAPVGDKPWGRTFLPLMAATGFALGMTAPIEVLYARRLGATDLGIAVFVVSSAIGLLLVDVFGTRVVPHLEARRALVGGVLLFGLSCLGYGASPGYWPLLAARLVQGFASAVLGGAALQAAIRVDTRRERALGGIQGALLLGGAVGAPVGGIVAALVPGVAGYRLAFVMCAGVCVLIAVGLRTTLAPLRSLERARIGLPRLSGSASLGLALVLGMLGHYLRGGVENTALPLVGDARGLSTATIGIALGVLAFVEIITLQVSGWLFRRVAPARCLVAALVIGVAAVVLLAVAPGPEAFFAAAIMFGFLDAVAMVAPALMILSLSADAVSGLAGYRIACGVGSLVGASSVAATIAVVGAAAAFPLVGGVLIGAIALVRVIGRRPEAAPG